MKNTQKSKLFHEKNWIQDCIYQSFFVEIPFENLSKNDPFLWIRKSRKYWELIQ